MSNKIHNCSMSLDEILNEDEPVEVTTLYGGEPNNEEAAEAFEQLFEESQHPLISL